jgi:hypothetical protein
MVRGRVAELNPWSCTTLEWTMPSPDSPIVNWGPYEYGESSGPEDFVMQDQAIGHELTRMNTN